MDICVISSKVSVVVALGKSGIVIESRHLSSPGWELQKRPYKNLLGNIFGSTFCICEVFKNKIVLKVNNVIH